TQYSTNIEYSVPLVRLWFRPGESINIGSLPVGNRALVVLRNGTSLVGRDHHLLSEVLQVLATQTEEVHLGSFSAEIPIDMDGEMRERVELARLEWVVDAASRVGLQIYLLFRLQARSVVKAHAIAVLEEADPERTLLTLLSDQAESRDTHVALQRQIDQQLLVAVRFEEASTIHSIVPLLQNEWTRVGLSLVEYRHLVDIDGSSHVVPYALDDGSGRQLLCGVRAPASISTMTVVAHS
ncbi:hypothetical protein PMAYCL1PPCAC_13342, partial [Pristionchus mayeri]